MKTALVTGATGFLGINLAKMLLDEGWQVQCTYRPSANLKYIKRLPVELINADLTDRDAVMKSFPGNVEIVFHCAADANFWAKRNKEQYANNVLATRYLVEASLKHKVKRFINTSTIVAFGPNGGQPITGDTPQIPDKRVNLSVTKKLAEDEVREGIKKGLDAVILNASGIVGPFDLRGWAGMFFPVDAGTPQVIPKGGVMTWCHVRDVARAHVNAVERGRTGYNYLLGGVETDWGGFLETAAKVIGVPIEVQRWPLWAMVWLSSVLVLVDRMRGILPRVTPPLMAFLAEVYRCDSAPAIEELDYKFTPLEEMVRDSYEWLVVEKFLKRRKELPATVPG